MDVANEVPAERAREKRGDALEERLQGIVAVAHAQLRQMTW